MNAGDKDAPGVIAPPPLIYLGGLAVGFGLDTLFPIAILPETLQYLAGGVLIAASLALAIPMVMAFHKAGTHVDVRKPATALVTSGPFRLSRNPAYLGATLLYAGIAIAADSLWVLVLLVPVLMVMHAGVISREERYLERKFGEDYRRYKASVRRWM